LEKCTIARYFPNNKNVDIKFTAHEAQYRNIGKSNNLEVFGNNKAKGLNRIAKIG
jgi:hypothetical protein